MEPTSGAGPHWVRANFAITYNPRAARDPCAVCGIQPHPFVGPELFLVDTWDIVCWRCGERYAPELVIMLMAWYESEKALSDPEDPLRPAA